MWSSEGPRRSAAELLLEAGAPAESAAGHLLRVVPQADAFVVSTLRQASRALAQGAAEAAVGYLTRALEEQLDPAVRAEVLVELGLAERRTNRCRGRPPAGRSRLLADPGGRGAVALELGRASGSPTGSRLPLPSSSGRSTRSTGSAIRTSHELLLAELAASAWWDPQTSSIAEARLGDSTCARSTEASAATSCSRPWRITRVPAGLHRDARIPLAGARSRPGTCWRAGRCILRAVVVLARAGLLDEHVRSSTTRSRRPRRRGDVFNVAFMLVWRGFCQTRRGDLRAAVADLREAMDLGVAHGLLMAWPYNVGFWHALLGRAERGRRTSSTRAASPSGYQSTRSTPSGFGSTAAASGSRPAGAGRGGCSRLARPLGDTPSTIQAACPGAAGPPRAFDSSTATRKRVRSPTRSSRSLDVWSDPHAIGAALRVLGLVERGEAGIGLLREAVAVLAGSKPGSSTRMPSSTSAQRFAGRTSGPKHVSGSERASTSRERSGARARRAGERGDRRDRCRPKVLQTGSTHSPRRTTRRAARGRRDEQQRDRANHSS